MARTDAHPVRANPSNIAECPPQDVQWVVPRVRGYRLERHTIFGSRSVMVVHAPDNVAAITPDIDILSLGRKL